MDGGVGMLGALGEKNLLQNGRPGLVSFRPHLVWRCLGFIGFIGFIG